MNDRTALYDGGLERTPDGGIIRFERHLPYDIREVWNAITTPERLADWWLPFDADITVDLREDGSLMFVGKPDGESVTMTCTILRLEPWDWEAFALTQAHDAHLGLAAPVDPL